MKRQRFMITAISLAVVVALVLVAVFGSRRGSPIGEKSVQIINSENQPVAFSELKGRVLFVNNWASWCPPCVAEMPSIQELKRKLKGVDVEFIMVSFDQDPKKAMEYMMKQNFDFKIYFPGQDYPFATASIPATFIIDKRGNTVLEHVGMTDYRDDEIANRLKALANE